LVRALDPPVLAAHRAAQDHRRRRLAHVVLALYLATVCVDAIRKVAAAPASTLGVIYVITMLAYLLVIPAPTGRWRTAPRTLPIWLFLLSLWCLAVALVQHLPPEMALLGWMSYVFFVPLLYVGAQLAADDRVLIKALRVVTLTGGVVGAGAIASAVLGASAPSLLQPIIPAVGIHSFTAGNVYLAPSFFATAEEAAEQLLVALFAWLALARLPGGIVRRPTWLILAMLILVGMVVAGRRANVYVAAAGIVLVLLLGRPRLAGRLVPMQAARAATATGRRLGIWVLAMAGALALALFLGNARMASFLASGSPGSRVSAMFAGPSSGSVLGQGPGTSTQGITIVDAASFAPGSSPGASAGYVLAGRPFITVEGGLIKTWLELGIMGVVLYGAVFWAALAPAVRLLRRLDGVGVALTVLAVALGIIFLKGHQSLDDPLIQPLFWLSVGGIWGRMRAAGPNPPPDGAMAEPSPLLGRGSVAIHPRLMA
jgi:hypothetical protein